MSTSAQKSPPSTWAWADPKFPLTSLRERWVAGCAMTAEEVSALSYNQTENPDVRVREECRRLLRAAESSRDASGGVAALRRRAMSVRLRKMIVSVEG